MFSPISNGPACNAPRCMQRSLPACANGVPRRSQRAFPRRNSKQNAIVVPVVSCWQRSLVRSGAVACPSSDEPRCDGMSGRGDTPTLADCIPLVEPAGFRSGRMGPLPTSRWNAVRECSLGGPLEACLGSDRHGICSRPFPTPLPGACRLHPLGGSVLSQGNVCNLSFRTLRRRAPSGEDL